jgi:hypothetical protein
MSESIDIRVSTSQRQALAQLARATHWPVADLVRTGIGLLLEQRDRVQPRRPLQEK